jgi:hypothetical protein
VIESMRKEGYRTTGVKVKDFHDVKGASEERRSVPVEPPPKRPPAPVEREKELYERFYKEERKQEEPKPVKEETKERRCLFHGAPAVATCPYCGALLCAECMKEGKCPRCKASLEGLGTSSDEKAPIEEAQRREREPRDWSRL